MLEHFSTISGEYSSLIQDGDEALPGDPIALISFWPLIDYNNMSRGTEHILSEPLFSSLAVDQIQDGKNRGLLQ